MVSSVQNSHSDPVTHISFLSMKLGNELVSTSTDGMGYWWDTRKFENPVEKLSLTELTSNGKERLVGGTVFEYNTEAGVKYIK